MSDSLPHNVEAERALLGTMLLNGFFDQSVLLAVDDFYSEYHQKIYLTMLEMSEAGDGLEAVTLTDALRKKGELEKAGGPVYVSSLTDDVSFGAGSEKSLREYVGIIRDSSKRRRAALLSNSISQLAATETFDVLSNEADRLRGIFTDNPEEESDDSLESIAREYREYVRRLDSLSIRFGIEELDERTGGFQLGEVVTIIARTGVGKSAVAQNVINHVLKSYLDAGVLFFSLEMPRLQALERHLQIYAGKTRSQVISAVRAGNGEAAFFDEFISRFCERFTIIDKAGITLHEIERRVNGLVALKRLNPVRLVVIDYLGYLGGGNKDAGLVERISELARDVKKLAKTLHCVVLLIAQTSRRAGDGSEEVTLTDARDSGAIEDSADFMIGCWRPELRKGLSVEEFIERQGELWMRILKARRGLQDKFCARFEGETMRVLTAERERVAVP